MEEQTIQLSRLERTALVGDWREAECLLSELEIVDAENVLFARRRGPQDEAVPLLVAVRHGHTQFVERLLEFGAKLNEEKIMDGYHESVVFAATKGDTDLLWVLAEARVISRSRSNCPDLVCSFVDAAKQEHFERVTVLLRDESIDYRGVVRSLIGLFILRGCPPSCLKVIGNFVGLSSHDCNGYTPLMWAVLAGNTPCIDFLLEGRTVEVNTYTKHDDWCLHMGARQGRTALMLAAGLCNIQSLKAMLLHVDRSVAIYDDSCALNYAAHLGNTAAVKLLIEWGAPMDTTFDPGFSVIDFAVQSGNSPCVKMVLASLSPADITFCIKNGYHDNKVRNTDILGALMTYLDDVLILDYDWNTLLISASTNGNLESVQLLLEIMEKSLANKFREDIQNSFLCACKRGHLSIAELLLQHGAIVKFCDECHMKTALIYACEKGNLALVNLLVSSGADINQTHPSVRKTALLYACEVGQNNVVDLLLKRGANIHAVDGIGWTALMYACINGNDEIADMLVKYGADVNTANACGETVLMKACDRGNYKLADLLVKQGASVHRRDEWLKTALIHACENEKDCDDIVELLIQSGAAIRDCDIGERNALMYACQKGHDAIVNSLITRGAQIDAVDSRGRTALMYSCQQGHATIVELLILLGADVNSFDNQKQTALMRVFSGVSGQLNGAPRDHKSCPDAPARGFERCLETLLSANADPDFVDAAGDTVFSIAMSGNGSLVKTLVGRGNLMNGGNLKPVHREAVSKATGRFVLPMETLSIALDSGVFEWNWYHFKYFPKTVLTFMDRGICPGKIKYDHNELYPLSFAFLLKYEHIVKIILDRLYFFEEDYTYLRTHCSGMKQAIYGVLFSKPLSLQTWSFLAVSKAISLAGPPILRPQRVEVLPIFPKLKRQLTFRAL